MNLRVVPCPLCSSLFLSFSLCYLYLITYRAAEKEDKKYWGGQTWPICLLTSNSYSLLESTCLTLISSWLLLGGQALSPKTFGGPRPPWPLPVPTPMQSNATDCFTLPSITLDKVIYFQSGETLEGYWSPIFFQVFHPFGNTPFCPVLSLPYTSRILHTHVGEHWLAGLTRVEISYGL